jgi:hypothetical protein
MQRGAALALSVSHDVQKTCCVTGMAAKSGISSKESAAAKYQQSLWIASARQVRAACTSTLA